MLQVIAICVGACVGALTRWGLGLWLNTAAAPLPWGTLAANLIGGYLIGICVAVFQALPQIDPVWRLALITGFLGGLTTFSTFSAEVTVLIQEGRILWATGAISAHVIGSLVMTMLGLATVSAFRTI